MRNVWYRRGAYWLVLSTVIATVAAIHLALGAALLAVVALSAADDTTRQR